MNYLQEDIAKTLAYDNAVWSSNGSLSEVPLDDYWDLILTDSIRDHYRKMAAKIIRRVTIEAIHVLSVGTHERPTLSATGGTEREIMSDVSVGESSFKDASQGRVRIAKSYSVTIDRTPESDWEPVSVGNGLLDVQKYQYTVPARSSRNKTREFDPRHVMARGYWIQENGESAKKLSRWRVIPVQSWMRKDLRRALASIATDQPAAPSNNTRSARLRGAFKERNKGEEKLA